ncbi:MAG: hypothetical protein K2F59_03665 [Eubacteriales bacterium]|nr:hypothetical protein [Eubacteriales bacterium]
MSNVILTLPEFAKFTNEILGLEKPLTFYQNLAKTGQLKNSYLEDNNRYYVKMDASVYQAKDMQEIIEENIRLKEKLENIKKLVD